MASFGTSRYDNSLVALRAAGDVYEFVHSDYKYHKQDWDLIRDLLAGERRIKEMGALYLPPLGKDGGSTYAAYKDRAVFVNMLSRTINAHIGTIFRRPIKVSGLSDASKKKLDAIGQSGESLNSLGKNSAKEIDAIGRVGLLLDRDENGNDPYITTYMAENILSWKEKIVDGRKVPSYVLLREVVERMRAVEPTKEPVPRTLLSATDNSMTVQYRVLRLDDNGNYIQEVYQPTSIDPSQPSVLPATPKVIRPTMNGAPMKFIPMVIIGPQGVGMAVQRSPILDIAYLNLAHYRTSAQLEHGRFFTALPVYYVAKAPGGAEQAEYTLGPSVVWECAPGEKPGILEFYGTGLKTLESSLIEKEEAISQLGGRIMGIRAAATSEAEAIFKMKQANETSILLSITESLAEALNRLVRWYFTWIGRESEAKSVKIEINQDFKALMIGARELRALALLYQEGMLPVNEVYRVLQEAEFIGDEVTVDEFVGMLTDPMQFPGQPNPEAMREGYADATSRDKFKLSKEEDARAASEADKARKQQQRQADQQARQQQQQQQQPGSAPGNQPPGQNQ